MGLKKFEPGCSSFLPYSEDFFSFLPIHFWKIAKFDVKYEEKPCLTCLSISLLWLARPKIQVLGTADTSLFPLALFVFCATKKPDK